MHIPIICPKNYYNCSVEIEYNPQKIFVLMPFGEEQAPQSLFTDVLKELPGWQVERADTDLSKPEIWCKICANIQESRAVIADLSGQNPNVFLELGLTWGLGRPFVLLAQDTRNLPFDTRTFHVIQYSRAEGDVKNPDELVSKILQSLDKVPQIPMMQQVKAKSPEVALYQRISDAKTRAVHLWRKSGGRFVLAKIEPSKYRVALSLLRRYPSSAMVKEIAEETKLSESRVSQILNGSYANTDRFFKKEGSKWILLDEGVYWTINEVVPNSVVQ